VYSVCTGGPDGNAYHSEPDGGTNRSTDGGTDGITYHGSDGDPLARTRSTLTDRQIDVRLKR